ncbi:DUF559 domain-containing protein [Telmatospirillum sp.]|uniref:endonuclease domain-containing protein n=1 Tax=Telmatospirillum sp. TaxID=2079197 RepID=UPI002846A378|nr:DUF559 domain-containing protein [Telmatospirillum sp.]MDR3436155.1 DUF559 domain-containing protein [Telmatospirillum sp.]
MVNQRARSLRHNQTDAERALWKQLRDLKAEGYHFRRQAPIGSYVAVFACHSAKLVIELDGGQHGTDVGLGEDRRRTLWIEGQGYHVVRFWNNDVLGNPEGVLWAIRMALSSSGFHPTPNPLPIKGRGDEIAEGRDGGR